MIDPFDTRAHLPEIGMCSRSGLYRFRSKDISTHGDGEGLMQGELASLDKECAGSFAHSAWQAHCGFQCG